MVVSLVGTGFGHTLLMSSVMNVDSVILQVQEVSMGLQDLGCEFYS